MRPVCRFLHLTAVLFLMCLWSCGERSTPPTDSLADLRLSESPLILAHRGASGYLPEHTLAAYTLAHAQGADYIETDVVMTKDSVLICSHDLTLDKTTDIARVYPDRARGGGEWHVIDFTMEELSRVRRGTTGQRSGGYEAGHRIVSMAELLGLIKSLNASTGRTVGVIPELKDPEFHREVGRPLEQPLVSLMQTAGYSSRADPAIIQSFDLESLRRIRRGLGCELRLVFLSGRDNPSDALLDEVAGFADGIGPNRVVVERGSGRLVERAHERGLMVFTYTFKNEPRAIAKHFDGYRVDGLFADFPDVAVRARAGSLAVPEPKPSEPPAVTDLDPQPTLKPNPCLVPVSSDESRGAAAGWGAGFTWMDQHEDINEAARAASGSGERVDVVLMGDSITQSWGGERRSVGAPGGAAREKHFGEWTTLNSGISGDRTQHLLWRIEHGNFDGISPRAVVLMIGTNNLSAGDSIEQIAAGVEAVVGLLLERLPETEVILSAVLPRGKLADDPMRVTVAMLNEQIMPVGEQPRVHYTNPAHVFLDAKGNARADLMAGDFLHLSPAGYDAWGAALADEIRRVLAGVD